MKNKFFIGIVWIVCLIFFLGGCINHETPAKPTETTTITTGTPVAPPSEAQFRKGPYLMLTGESTSMIVLWQTTATPNEAIIEWGTDRNYSLGKAEVKETGNGKDEHQFIYKIENLQPDSIIYYRVTVDGEAVEASFKTAPKEDDTKLTFYAYGDTRTHPAIHDAVCAQVVRAVEENPQETQTFIINGGDFVTYGLAEQSWDNEYFNRTCSNTMKMLASIPVVGALGNHENYPAGEFEADRQHLGELFRKYWPNPLFEKPENFYYSFDYGPAHFIAIDQYTTDYGKGSEQYQWVENELRNTDKKWKIVFFHQPGWTSSEKAYSTHHDKIMIEDYTPLFERENVKVVIQSHNHIYTRNLVNGTQYLTLGGGGAELDKPYPESDYLVKVLGEYHFGKFEINGDDMYVEIINENGEVIDSFSVSVAPETQIEKVAKSFCGKENVAKVYVCGPYVRVVSRLQGGGSTFYDENGTEVAVCPVMAPAAMSEECRLLLLGNNCIEKEIC